MQDGICELVRKAEADYTTGVTTVSKYVETSQFETINRVDAYLNSRHVSGPTDSLGREKPFFNIAVSARNIWYRATDLDRRHIKVRAAKSSDHLAAFLATAHLQEWMRREDFGSFLNDWGLTLASYGSAIAKFVEKDGRLHAQVVPWNRVICDTVDFEGAPVIEKLYLSAGQLRNRKGYDRKMVEKLLEAKQARKTLDGHVNQDQKDDYIEVYEVHGELPLSMLTGNDKDEDEYVHQMHVVSFVAGKEKGEYDDYTLASGREAKSPYMLSHLIRAEGQTLSIGAVQNLFEAQWMVNHTAKAIKDQLDLASKMVFQTSDASFSGQNAISAVETGDILVHQPNQPLTHLANNANDITALQSFASQWKALGAEINGISEAMQGLNQPAGSAWRQTEALLAESHSLFELMAENKGLAIERMLREFVIPHVKRKMDTSDEIAATLEDHDIRRIDAKFVPAEAARRANRQIIDASLKGQLAAQPDVMAISSQVQGELSSLGNQRFFKPSAVDDRTWKEVFKGLEWDLEVDVTSESVDREDAVTLSNVLKTVATNPAVLSDPKASLAFNKILSKTGGISPVELASLPSSPAMPMQVPINQ